jgi:hypothetical protein
MRSPSLLILVVVAAACGSVNVSDGDSDAGDTSDHTDPDGGGPPCEPDTVSCADSTLSVCGADGRATLTECALGCFDDTRCADLVASNGLTMFLDDTAEAEDVELLGDTVIDTDDGDISIDGSSLQVTTILLAAPGSEGGIPVRVFVVRSLSVTGDVTVVGDAALAFVSDGDIAIGGHVRTRAGRGIDGTGGGEIEGECFPQELPYRAAMGGGGYGKRGGSGGAIGDFQDGGTAGPAVGGETLIPLRGGGNSASPSPVGGGAIQLVSRTRIAVEGGSLDAGGQAGDIGQGGGAGGGILLEAPAVLVAAAGAVAANGGGGGCGLSSANPAEDGRLDDRRAAGCQSADSNGDGGAGGAGDETGAGQAGESISCGLSGAGGGGVGRIRINTKGGNFAPTGGAIVSPPASVGTVAVR